MAAVVATSAAQSAWTWMHLGDGATSADAVRGLVMQVSAVALFTAWPFLTATRFRADQWAWRAGALAAPLWFLSLRQLFTLRFGDAFIGLLPLALAALSLAALMRARAIGSTTDPLWTGRLAWFSAAALGFVSVAIPLQLEKEWITVGWALEGLAVMALWVRLDHPGLKYFGLALLAAVTVRLVGNDAVLGYYPRPAWRIVNWLLYTYLVPAAALFGAATLLGRHEVSRARDRERPLYAAGQPVGALVSGLAGLVVVFVWINLAIADWFSTGPMLTVSFAKMPARDLTTSIAWAVYALVLLTIGMVRGSTGLRWVSLALTMITIAKVFLYDLGELRDLYRVASLLGLAVSLILISLAYQRFVFRNARADEP
jgi:uncharacterized membrane protein